VRDETIARSYAETLIDLAERHEGLEVFGKGIETVAALLDEIPAFRTFLETPRVDSASKKAVLRKAFGDSLPPHLLSFVLITIDKRRQRLLREMARQYHALLDERLGRARIEVTLARRPDEAWLAILTDRLSEMLGKTAIPHVRIRPEILGGILVRDGDTIYDGSLRRRLSGMRRRLLQADMPAAAGPTPAG
jgi:F-type H+-transporting ATPase subunit delta